MAKQRCGSCRFFQDAGLAGSGWCHHPLRKTTSDLLIMVRRNELACRDEWTRTLWEEGTFGQADIAGAHPVDPATEIEIAALVRTDLTSDDTADIDIVLGEARLVSDATPPWRLPGTGLAMSAAPPPPAAFDSRTAILKAREAYRERQKAAERERTPATLSGDAPLPDEPGMTTLFPGNADLPAAVRADEEPGGLPASWPGNAVGDLGLEDSALDRPEVAWEPAGFVDDDAGPARVDSLERLPAAGSPDAFPPLPEADHAPWGADVEPDPAVARQPEAIPLEPLESGDDAWSPARPGWSVDPLAAEGTDWSPVGTTVSDDEWWEPVATADAAPSALPEPDAEGGWRGTPVWDEAWIAELARESARGEDWTAWDLATEDDEPADAPRDADVLVTAGENVAWVAPEPIDVLIDRPAATMARIEIAPGVPRICRTCRDFRPADGGDRGWCANQWAFTHRRLVDPDEPAPCESSIGNWWLPADELYIGDADISAHGLSTPLLDRWLPGHVVAEPERKRS